MERADAAAAGGYPATFAGQPLIVTRFLVVVATWRLAMSEGSQPALAGTVTGPVRQASQTPVISVAPALERTIRRHGTLSGSPSTRSSMLVPQDVAVRAAVALTCKAGFAPESVTVAGRWLAARGASQNPPAAPAMAATDATMAAARQVRAERLRDLTDADRSAASVSSGTRASRPGSGLSSASSAWHAGQPGRWARTCRLSSASAAPST